MKSNTYNEVDEDVLKELKNIVGSNYVITDKDSMVDYKKDQSSSFSKVEKYPDVLIKPRTTEEISKIVRLANENMIPITPMGGKTGLVGGAIPIYGGIALSLERKNNDILVDEENIMVEVDAGVTMGDLYEAVEEKNLSLPIHPTTEDSFVGGTISTNASGENSLRHGLMRNYVKGIEVVLPNGEVINLGGKILKNNTGYSLLHLMIGSEGTLGIITRATLRLYPPSEKPRFVIVPFSKKEDAIKAVPEIIKKSILPDGIEYLEKKPIENSEKEANIKWPVEKGEATLMISISGMDENEILNKAEKIMTVCEENNAIDLFLATKTREVNNLIKIREVMGENPGMDDKVQYWDPDFSVPVSEIPTFLEKTREILENSSTNGEYYTYGHAGDGNIHTGAFFPEDDDIDEIKKVHERWIKVAIELGGSVSGEHGIGIFGISDLKKYRSEEELRLMKGIKKLFDPNNIMNPGKVIPE